MLVHEIDNLLEATPFVPFTVVLSDGRQLSVSSREFAWHPPAYRTAWIAVGGAGKQRVHMIDLHLVAEFSVQSGGLPSTASDADTRENE